ncbi:MAG: hypothetical protein IKO16_09050 [Lachnospiraceae bacterium]|nr:hypothetical protein [Lachnospiraceae bacterium]
MEHRGRSLSFQKFIETVPPSLCLIFVCVVFCLLMSYRKIYFYDDLSYWAIYTKNIFAIDKLPTLFENCSVDYKDYTPVIQILQYLVMFGRSEFSEASMFRTNICLIYVLLLPVLSAAFDGGSGTVELGDAAQGSEDADLNQGAKRTGIRIAAVILYVIFPHILTAQFYYRLGVDLLLALTFGYVLYYVFLYNPTTLRRGDVRQGDGGIVSKNLRQYLRPPVSRSPVFPDEAFRLVCIACALAFLALIKTSGPVLAIMAVIMFAVHEGMSNAEKSRKKAMQLCAVTAVLCVFTLGAFLSWQWFLRRSWNNGYLSNRVKAGVKGGAFAFPPYTREVTLNYIRHFFTVPLTGNRIGVTAFVLVLFIFIVFFIQRSETKGQKLRQHLRPPVSKKLRQHLRPPVSIVVVMAGLVIFAAAHLGMYLFIFDEWEAHGLVEFDRYITQYLGGAFMLYACSLIGMACNDRISGAKTALYVSLAVFVVLLPYADMAEYLVPADYRENYEQNYKETAEAADKEWAASGIAGLDLPHDGSARLTLIADQWDPYTQFLVYSAVPQPIDCVVNTPAIAEGELLSYIDDHLEAYVYVADNAAAAYPGDWNESAELTADHTPLQPGTLYRVVKENDTKTLVVAE